MSKCVRVCLKDHAGASKAIEISAASIEKLETMGQSLEETLTKLRKELKRNLARFSRTCYICQGPYYRAAFGPCSVLEGPLGPFRAV